MRCALPLWPPAFDNKAADGLRSSLNNAPVPVLHPQRSVQL